MSIEDIEKPRVQAIKKFLLKLQNQPAALAWLGDVNNVRTKSASVDPILAKIFARLDENGSFVHEGTPHNDVTEMLKVVLMPSGPDGLPRLFIARQPERVAHERFRNSNGIEIS